ncbi:MAG: hypothetical protein K0U52_07170 [Gammaproteobacteria bacterium]|nr:hypothetical protein [Gammaproteobacteria bacterium]
MTDVSAFGDLTTRDLESRNIDLWNNTETNADGGRSTALTFHGETAAGAAHTLGQMTFSHLGAAADETGQLEVFLNDGDDSNSPTSVLTVDVASGLTATKATFSDAVTLSKGSGDALTVSTADVQIGGDLNVDGTITGSIAINDNVFITHATPAAAGKDMAILMQRHEDEITAETAAENDTAQAGAASTITLASGANATDDYYNGWYVETTGGTGSGQIRKITDYNGTTKVATVASAWSTNPDVTTTYDLFNQSQVGLIFDEDNDVMILAATAATTAHTEVGANEYLDLHAGSLQVTGSSNAVIYDAATVGATMTMRGSRVQASDKIQLYPTSSASTGPRLDVSYAAGANDKLTFSFGSDTPYSFYKTYSLHGTASKNIDSYFFGKIICQTDDFGTDVLTVDTDAETVVTEAPLTVNGALTVTGLSTIGNTLKMTDTAIVTTDNNDGSIEFRPHTSAASGIRLRLENNGTDTLQILHDAVTAAAITETTFDVGTSGNAVTTTVYGDFVLQDGATNVMTVDVSAASVTVTGNHYMTGANSLIQANDADGVFTLDNSGTANIKIYGTSHATKDDQIDVTADSFNMSGDASVGGALTVTGNLTVSGTTTTIDSTTLTIDDNMIVVNSGPAASKDAGLLIQRYEDDIIADTAAASGTAQAGASTTITLAAGASATDDIYNGWYVEITGGTGSGQVKKITDYVGATKVATVASSWSTNPDNTSTYELFNHPFVGLMYDESADQFAVVATSSDPTSNTATIEDYIDLKVSALSTVESVNVASGKGYQVDSNEVLNETELHLDPSGATPAGTLYFGDSGTNGNIRILVQTDTILFQKRESGSWVTKHEFGL